MPCPLVLNIWYQSCAGHPKTLLSCFNKNVFGWQSELCQESIQVIFPVYFTVSGRSRKFLRFILDNGKLIITHVSLKMFRWKIGNTFLACLPGHQNIWPLYLLQKDHMKYNDQTFIFVPVHKWNTYQSWKLFIALHNCITRFLTPLITTMTAIYIPYLTMVQTVVVHCAL